MSIDYAILGNNATVFISKFSKYGTLLNVCNKVKAKTGKNLDEYLVMIVSIQMLSILKQLHDTRIIHADIKPDNFLIMKPLVLTLLLICSINLSLVNQIFNILFIHSD